MGDGVRGAEGNPEGPHAPHTAPPGDPGGGTRSGLQTCKSLSITQVQNTWLSHHAGSCLSLAAPAKRGSPLGAKEVHVRQGQRDGFLQLTAPPLWCPRLLPSLLCPCPQHLRPHLVPQSKRCSSGGTAPAHRASQSGAGLSAWLSKPATAHGSCLTSTQLCAVTQPHVPLPRLTPATLCWPLHVKHASFPLTLTAISRHKFFWVPSATWETALLLGGLNPGRSHRASSHILPSSNLDRCSNQGPRPSRLLTAFSRPWVPFLTLQYQEGKAGGRPRARWARLPS